RHDSGREMERTPLDRAHNDLVGHRCDTYGLRSHEDPVLLTALHTGSGGGRFLSRNNRLSQPLVSLRGSSESRGDVHGGDLDFQHHRFTGIGFAARNKLAGAGGLALAVYHRRSACNYLWRNHDLLSYRSPASSSLARG